jgi:hypothetical protein
MHSKSLYSPKVISRLQRTTLKMSNPRDERSSWKVYQIGFLPKPEPGSIARDGATILLRVMSERDEL